MGEKKQKTVVVVDDLQQTVGDICWIYNENFNLKQN